MNNCPWFYQWWALDWEMWDYGSDELGRPLETQVFDKIQSEAQIAFLIRAARDYRDLGLAA